MYNDRAALLDRCLRLEARLLGVAVDPPTVVEYAPVSAPAPLHPHVFPRRQQRKVTPADIAQMRELRARGMTYHAIGERVTFADSTVRVYARDVQVAV